MNFYTINNRRAPHHHRAFSLIELLISLSIISLLMGLALPALQHAREKSWEMVCGSHLHQIGIGLTNFATENFDKLPREGHAQSGEFISWPTAIMEYMGNRNSLTSPVYKDPAHPNPNHFSHFVMNGINFRSDQHGDMVDGSGFRRGVSNASTIKRPSEIIYMTSFTDDPDNSIARQVHSWNPAEIQAVYDVWLEIHLYGPDHGSNRIATNVRRIGWNRHGSTNNVLHFDMHISKMTKPQILDEENWYDGVPRKGKDPQFP